MIGLQDLIIRNKIKVSNLARQIEINPSTIWSWFKSNHIPNKYLTKLAEILETEEEYLNKQVNEISTYKPRIRKLNKYEIRGSTTAIFMLMKTGEIVETLIDTEDLEKVIKTDLIWHAVGNFCSKTYYAKATTYKQKPSTISLHRIIMDVTDPLLEVDHKNHNTLDNRKSNLRVVDKSTNKLNRMGANSNSSSGHRNVNWNSDRQQWAVQFWNGEANECLAYFTDIKQAIKYADQNRSKYGHYIPKSE